MKHKSKLTLLFTVSMLMLSSCTDSTKPSSSENKEETSSQKAIENSSTSSEEKTPASSSNEKSSTSSSHDVASSSSESRSSSEETSSSSEETPSSSEETPSSSEETPPSSSEDISSSDETPISSEEEPSSSVDSQDSSSEEPIPEVIYYTVTFDSMGGSEVPSQNVEEGKLATKPTDPTKDNCTFEGWYLSSSFKKEFDFNTIITTDYTLFAKWKENETVDPDPTPDPTPEVTLVDYWIAGDFCSWQKEGAIQMEENPSGSDLAMKLGVEIEAGKCFKITNYTDWYGYNSSLVDVATGSDGSNICIKESATYNIYLNCYYQVWIEKVTDSESKEEESSGESGGESSSETEKGDSSEETSIHAPAESSLVDWYLLGSGSLWDEETGWSKEGGVQLFSNPTGDDLACILNLEIAVGDIFKISDGDSIWIGYSNVDSWDDSSNLGKNNFEATSSDDNFECKIAGTYNIYLNEKDGNKNVWITSSSVTEEE